MTSGFSAAARGTATRTGAFATRGFSMVEMLCCVAIVGILSVISVNSYQGALDQADLKYAAPGVVGRLEKLRLEAAAKGTTIKVEFHLADSRWTITRRKAGETLVDTQELSSERLIKRNLRFLRYQWPDGGDDPAEFVFAGSSTAQGGTVWFGTGKAETAIRVEGGRVGCDLGIRNPR